jgi:spermidine/putrescine transport system permease protein
MSAADARLAAGGTVSSDPVRADPPSGRRRSKAGYWLLLPGMLWLVVFFLVPTIQLAATSLYDPNGSLDTGYAMTWSFSNYWDALSGFRAPFLRSLLYAALATAFAVVLAYPLA